MKYDLTLSMSGQKLIVPGYRCDECLLGMGPEAYYSVSDTSHLCWDCAGPYLEPDTPGDRRRELIAGYEGEKKPTAKKKARRHYAYDDCKQHAVPCTNPYDHGPFDPHYTNDWCCYYCCEACKDKCEDPVLKQVRVKVKA